MAKAKQKDTTLQLRRIAVELYEAGWTVTEIGQELERSRWRICQYLEREGVPRRRPREMHAPPYDPNAFDKHTPQVAYFAGALHARGSFSGKDRIAVRSSQRDQGQFYKLREFLDFADSRRDSALLRYVPPLSDDLRTWAFTPVPPASEFFEQLAKEKLEQFFFRGYWDYRVFIQPTLAVLVGPRPLVEGLKKFVMRRIGNTPDIASYDTSKSEYLQLVVHRDVICRVGKQALYRSKKGPRFGPIYVQTVEAR